jgi:hypothetical protein
MCSTIESNILEDAYYLIKRYIKLKNNNYLEQNVKNRINSQKDWR